MKPVYITEIPGLELLERRGIFDIYRLEDGRHLYLATDRFYYKGRQAAHPVPGRGVWFTQIASYVMAKFNYFLSSVYQPEKQQLPESIRRFKPLLHQRSIVARPVKAIPVRCMVLATVGETAWDEFQREGTIAGIPVPQELRKGYALPFPIFAPKIMKDGEEPKRFSTFVELKDTVGPDVAQFLQDKSIEAFIFAVKMLEQKGILLQSASFEYGFAGDQVILMSYPLTPGNAALSLRKAVGADPIESCLDDRLVDLIMERNEDKPDPRQPLHLPQDITHRLGYAYELYCNILTKEDQHRT